VLLMWTIDAFATDVRMKRTLQPEFRKLWSQITAPNALTPP
jgi:hypothetical protein